MDMCSCVHSSKLGDISIGKLNLCEVSWGGADLGGSTLVRAISAYGAGRWFPRWIWIASYFEHEVTRGNGGGDSGEGVGVVAVSGLGGVAWTTCMPGGVL